MREGRQILFTLGDRIRVARVNVPLNQKDLGKAIGGVSRETIASWEKSKTHPNMAAVLAIAQACGVDYSWITAGLEGSSPAPQATDSRNESILQKELLVAKNELLASKNKEIEAQKEIIQLQRQLLESTLSPRRIEKIFQELVAGHDRIAAQSLLDKEVSEQPSTKSAKKKEETSQSDPNHSWKGWKEEERGLAINA